MNVNKKNQYFKVINQTLPGSAYLWVCVACLPTKQREEKKKDLCLPEKFIKIECGCQFLIDFRLKRPYFPPQSKNDRKYFVQFRYLA